MTVREKKDTDGTSAPQRLSKRTSILVVCFCVVLSMYSYTSLFPYVGYMVADFTGRSPNEAGYMSGNLAGAYALARTTTSYPLGWAADRVGRKPVMVFSLFAMAAFSLAFGLSESYEGAMVTRVCLGLCNGVLSTARALMPEVAGKDYVVAATSYIAGASSLGLIMGPALGGFLSCPAERCSGLSSMAIFVRYPYLLPNLLLSCLALIAIPLTIWFIPETGGASHDGQRRREAYPPSRVTPARCEEGQMKEKGNVTALGGAVLDVAAETEQEGREPGGIGLRKLMSVPTLPVLLFMAFVHSGATDGLDEVYPLWAISSSGVGGLEYSTLQIGEVLCAAGLGLLLFQFVIYPRLVGRIGVMVVQNTSSIAAAILVMLLPNLAVLSWNSTSLSAMSSILITLFQCAQTSVLLGILLAGTNAVPSHLRGKLSGLLLMAQNIGRALGQDSSAAILAWSLSRAGGHLPFVDHRFVFTIFAFLFGLVGVLGAVNLNEKMMTTIVEEASETLGSGSEHFDNEDNAKVSGGTTV